MILLMMIDSVSAGCWGYNNNCDDVLCYTKKSQVTAYDDGLSGCYITTNFQTHLVYHNFNTECPQNKDKSQLTCYDGRGTSTYYNTYNTSGPCSSCTGTLDCASMGTDIKHNSACDKSTLCYEDWFIICLGCKASSTNGCPSQTSNTNCLKNNGCSWSTPYTAKCPAGGCNTNEHIYYNFYNPIQGKLTYEQCEYYPTLCKKDYKLNPNTNICVIPSCLSDFTCVERYGPGYFCNNSGEWNAKCSVIPGYNFGAKYSKTINQNPLSFLIQKDDGDSTYMNIKNESSNEVIYYNVKSTEFFMVGDKNYKPFFTLPSIGYSFSLYETPTVERLTYNIFPVCGNGICETCESSDNCLNYPPESCLSCPKDCPYLRDSDWNSFEDHKIETGLVLDIFPSDAYADPNLACKVRTRDAYSICNPLCISHDYIDDMGCLFNKYANAITSDEFNNSLDKIDYTSNKQDIKALNKINVTFNDEIRKAFSDGTGSFYGLNNSLCSQDCECVSGNCADCYSINTECSNDGKHCCPRGYTWSYSNTKKTKYCLPNGTMEAEYREVFENYDPGNEFKILSTIDVTNPLTTGVSATKYINVDKNSRMPDPFCVYETGEIVKDEGIGQCRPISDETIEIPIEDLRCTIHTHAWATTHCLERKSWYNFLNPTEYRESASSCLYSNEVNRPYYNYFCVTDNPLECASNFGVMSLYKNSAPVLRSITYEQFCHTPNLVCGSSTLITNEQNLPSNIAQMKNSNIGGTILFNSCPQDGVVFVDSEWYELVDAELPKPVSMSVGYYCSLFGNDYERIIGYDAGNTWNLNGNKNQGYEIIDTNMYTKQATSSGVIPLSLVGLFVNSLDQENYDEWMVEENGVLKVKAHHMPIINRDAEEKLYHLLWNYESCKQVYDDIDFNCDAYSVKKDEKGQPVNNGLGTYDFSVSSYSWLSSYIKSRDYCDGLWEEYNRTHRNIEYDWKNFSPSFSYGIYDEANTKLIIQYSCMYWYPPFLDDYYNPSISAENLGITIDSHLNFWGRIVTKSTAALSVSYQYLWLDSTFMKKQSDWGITQFCSDTSGTILPSKKCSSIYPNALNDGKRDRIEPNNRAWKSTTASDIDYNSCDCFSLDNSEYFNSKVGCW